MAKSSEGPVGDAENLREAIVVRRPAHPALARLYDAAVADGDPREITSYDRMHHRHNRS
jgi:hypothetical protein